MTSWQYVNILMNSTNNPITLKWVGFFMAVTVISLQICTFQKYYVTIWMTQSIKIDVMHRKRKSRCLQRPSLWLCFPFLSSFYKVNIDRIDWFFDHLIDIFDTLETQNLILSLFFHFQYSNNCVTCGQQRLRYITISSSSSLS